MNTPLTLPSLPQTTTNNAQEKEKRNIEMKESLTLFGVITLLFYMWILLYGKGKLGVNQHYH
jgi:hypothetical protein